MEVICHENGPFCVNTYLVINEKTSSAFIIDPGSKDISELIDIIKKNNYNLEAVVCTHAHIDHVAGVPYLIKKYKIPFYLCKLEEEIIKSLSIQARMFGVPDPGKLEINEIIPMHGNITFGGIDFTILHTPGHSPGSISLYNGDTVFVGDALFNMSIGRTDLPGGNYIDLITSIRKKLFTLPENTRVLCGHGPETIMGIEKQMNPFFS